MIHHIIDILGFIIFAQFAVVAFIMLMGTILIGFDEIARRFLTK